MKFEDVLKDFTECQGTQYEAYEMDKNGIITELIFKIPTGQLRIRKKDKFILILQTNEFRTKLFESLNDALEYLFEHEIQFKEIIPTNLGKMFSIL